MNELMAEINSQMQSLPGWVQIWVNWMMAVFLASIAFIWHHRAARLIFFAFILTMPMAMLIFYFCHNVHLFALAHLTVWTPLLVYFYKSHFVNRNLLAGRIFNLWLTLLILTIIISLILDVRDVVLVLLGKK